MRSLRRFWRCKAGTTSIEYGFILVFVSALILAGAGAIGTKINAKFTPISNNLN